MQVGSQSQTYGASNPVFNKSHFHGDKKKKKKTTYCGDFSEVYIKFSSFHFGEKQNAILVLLDSKSKG